MKHKALFLAAFAAAGMLLLTACTSSEEGIAQSVRSGSDGSAGTADQGNGDAGGTQDAAGQDAVGQDPAAGGDVQAEPPGQTETSASTAGSETTEAPATEPQTTEAPETEFLTEVPKGDASAEDIWSGTYVGDQETVTITLIDAGNLSFSFANAGIASTAVIDGYQAVYDRGDDHHVVVFEINEDLLNVTVTSEEDFDASASPINGTYVRE